MPPPFVPSPVDPRLYALLAQAGFGDALFNPRQHRSCELVEHYVLQLAIDLVARLELAPLAMLFTGLTGFAIARWLLRIRRPRGQIVAAVMVGLLDPHVFTLLFR